MSDVSFVRTEMLPERTPPVGQQGLIKWFRENMFSSIPNSILSIVAMWAIYAVLSHILPWVFQSSWNASSLKECRANIVAEYGEGTSGACWGVIHERVPQLIYGFYPQELRWRPDLAFIGMLIALAPVLFDKLPRKMIWFSAIYPFLAFWLLWGGSIWLPISIVAGFALGVVAFKVIGKMFGSLAGMIALALVPIIWWILFAGGAADIVQSIIPLSIQSVPSSQFGGLSLSIIIGVTGIAFSLPIGIVLALGRQSDLMIVKVLCVGFIEFIRGVPLITLLFVASTLLNYFMPPGTNFDIILRVIIMVTLFSASYMA